MPKLATYCQNADNKALFVPLDSCAQNTDNDDQWACGCPNAVADCSLCEDGTSFLTTRASDFSKRGETCAYDQFSLKYIVGVDCTAIRGTLGKTCGCSNTKSELSVCRICGTGKSLPNPNLFVPSFGHTCGFIEYYATAQANSGKKSCTFYRGEYVDVCCNGGPDPYKTNSPNEDYELAEKLVDFEDYFRRWRFNHVTTVERVIGFKRGTGGTSGVAYLRRMLEIELFPELWHLRTTL